MKADYSVHLKRRSGSGAYSPALVYRNTGISTSGHLSGTITSIGCDGRPGAFRVRVSSMDAIHINTKLDSDTLYLPQIRPLIGETVEITVREKAVAEQPENGRSAQRSTWLAALAGLAELDIDWDAYRRQREYDVRSASDHAE